MSVKTNVKLWDGDGSPEAIGRGMTPPAGWSQVVVSLLLVCVVLGPGCFTAAIEFSSGKSMAVPSG
jgi:hypothetical protein